jgi:hypothetical protein
MVVILFLVAALALLGIAAKGWGVDSSDASMDPRLPGRPSI